MDSSATSTSGDSGSGQAVKGAPDRAGLVSVREALLVEAERAAHLGSWTWDLRTQEVSWSDELYRILGLDPEVTPAGAEAFFGAIHEEDLDRVREATGRALEAGVPERIELRFVRPDGGVRSIVMDGAFLRDDSGRIVQMVGGCLDVTERRELEEKLRRSQKMDTIGRLAGGIAHDFNNVLTVIVANAELLLSARPESVEAAEIVRAAERASAMTSRLLAFSRGQNPDPEPVDLNEVAEEACGLVLPLFGDRLPIRLTRAPEPCPVRADSTQLVQVLMNLLVNARDATVGRGEVRVSLGERLLPEGRRPAGVPTDRFVELRVEDEGEGMDEATRRRVFDPFFTTKPPGEGTGLGLSIVQGIVEAHRGLVELDSVPGQGTEFRILLPYCDALPAGERRTLTAVRSGGRATVLLVEDEDPVRLALGRLLEQAGFAVLSAPGPAEASALFGPEVSLLVTDVVMPGGSGGALAEELLEIRPDLPVLYITGHAPEELDLPPAPVLHKPFRSDRLLEAVRSLLDG